MIEDVNNLSGGQAPESGCDKPEVGIVVPAYRAERFVLKLLRSLANQSNKSWECIVVDDGSPDNTGMLVEEFAKSDNRVRLLSQANGGAAAARNRGLAALSPSVRYVTCMDADDVYLPDALRKLKCALEASPDADAVHALGTFIDEGGQPINVGDFERIGLDRLSCSNGRIRRLGLSEPTTFASIVTSSTVFPPGLVLTRREFVAKVAGYDVSMTGAEDWDFLIRLSRHGNIKFLNEVVVQYRRHGSNQGAGLLVPEMCRRVRHKTFFSPENSEEHRCLVRESWRACQLDLAKLRLREAWQHFKHFRPIKSLLSFSRIPFIGYRYLRGYPTLGWL